MTKREKSKKEMMQKVYRNTSILITGLVCFVVLLSVLSGESRLMMFRRVGWILMSIMMFFIGIVAGVKYVYKLKVGEIIGDEKVKEGEDGVTK